MKVSVNIEGAPLHAKTTEARSGSDDYKVLCVRMRASELEGFTEEIERHQLTSSMALRIAARRIAGFLEIDAETRFQMETLVQRVGEMSGSLRALHQAYVADGFISLSDLEAQRSSFGQQFAQLDALLRTILNVSQRRADGRRRLAEALL